MAAPIPVAQAYQRQGVAVLLVGRHLAPERLAPVRVAPVGVVLVALLGLAGLINQPVVVLVVTQTYMPVGRGYLQRQLIHCYMVLPLAIADMA